MARKPLRSQLNQIRAWVREGRTDAWIAHQLDVSASELKEFRRRHGLTAEGGDDMADDDLRDEIEAEIEAATLTEEDDEEAEEAVEAASPAGEAEDGGGSGRRRRRRRRRGARKKKALEGTFDHGETDGFGLWLDPAIQDEPTYTEHWAGHRAVEVEVEPDRIVIRRSE
jgi:hypothetical protein